MMAHFGENLKKHRGSFVKIIRKIWWNWWKFRENVLEILSVIIMITFEKMLWKFFLILEKH